MATVCQMRMGSSLRAFGLRPVATLTGWGVQRPRSEGARTVLDLTQRWRHALARQTNDAIVTAVSNREDQRLFSSTTLTNWTQFRWVIVAEWCSAFAVFTNRFAITNRVLSRVHRR